MKRIVIVVFAVMLILPIATGGWGGDKPAESQAKGEPPSWRTSSLAEETATVKAIDQSTRMVTLKGPKGNEITFKAGEEVRNLAQVQVGDEVKFRYYESLAVRVLKAGEAPPMTGEAAAMKRAKPGEMPAGVVAKERTILATITAIDKKEKTATLKLEDGESVTVTPRIPENLEKVKVGDRLVITYTEAVAVKVDRVEKKK